MKFVDRVFDAGFDDIATDSRRLQPWRLLVALVVAGLVASLLGYGVALIWGGGLAMSECWTWFAVRAFGRATPPTQMDRLNYLGSAVAVSGAWMVLSAALWTQPQPWAPVAAVMVWATLILSGISVAYRSSTALIPFAGPPSVVMVVLPALAPRFSGLAQTLIILGAIVCVAYAAISARRSVRVSRRLADARTELATQKAAAEAANHAKSAFLALMSHELRTPMNGVLGMAYALDLTSLDPGQRRQVRALIQSGDGLMSILDDVLDLVRIESDNLAIEARNFDLRDLLTKAWGAWSAPAAEKGLTLDCEIHPAAPRWVTGDPVRLRQILFKLLSNALKFTEYGDVRMYLGPVPQGVEIRVSDTGPGLDAEVRAHIFERFASSPTPEIRRHGGAGLGLAISQNLAHLMGGRVAVESQPGAGSTFILTLPLTAVDPPADQPQTTAPRPRADRLEVLVVDDNAVNRQVAETLLMALGCEVVVAASGPAALAILERRSFDLFVMDIHMPVMDGIEATRLIRSGAAGDPETPIIALTADATAGQRERLLSLGFDEFLTKPISPAILAQALARVRPYFED